MRKVHYFISFVIMVSLIISCNENTAQKEDNLSDKIERPDSSFKEQVAEKSSDTTIKKVAVKLFQNKITVSSNDSIVSYKTVKSKDENCTNWVIPPKSELINIIATFYEISGSEWNDCYGDYNCGVEGKILFQSKKYNYRLDAGGWIILFNKNEQRYFGCKNPNCKKYFPSDCFCNEDGIIDQ